MKGIYTCDTIFTHKKKNLNFAYDFLNFEIKPFIHVIQNQINNQHNYGDESYV